MDCYLWLFRSKLAELYASLYTFPSLARYTLATTGPTPGQEGLTHFQHGIPARTNCEGTLSITVVNGAGGYQRLAWAVCGLTAAHPCSLLCILTVPMGIHHLSFSSTPMTPLPPLAALKIKPLFRLYRCVQRKELCQVWQCQSEWCLCTQCVHHSIVFVFCAVCRALSCVLRKACHCAPFVSLLTGGACVAAAS